MRQALIFLIFLLALSSCRKTIEEIPVTLSTHPYEDQVYRWFKGKQLDNGLVPSCETCPISLYGNSLSAMVFTLYGDLERSEKIFDFFQARLSLEFEQDSGGFHQFRHWNGNPVRKQQWMGDNAWLLIALNNYKAKTGSAQYDSLRFAIEQWLRKLQRPGGALIAGYNGNQINSAFVTEGIIDAFNAVPGYDNFHLNILSFLKLNRWDSTHQSLTTGWAPYPRALDLHPWAYCIFEDFPEATLQDALRYEHERICVASKKWVNGYCFDEDRDNIWFEGTGQMAVAFDKANDFESRDFYLKELEDALIVGPDSSLGIPYASNSNSTRFGGGALSDGEASMPFVASGAWYLFALNGFDPFAVTHQKGMTESDKFWQD